MREMHLQNVDLNLLYALYALLEERHVSHAAKRTFLSQPRDESEHWTGYAKHSEILRGQTSTRRVVRFAGHFATFMPFASQSLITVSPGVASSYSFCAFLG